MAVGGVAAGADVGVTMIYAGTVRGFSWHMSDTTHTAGTIKFRVRKNGAADATLELTSGTTDTSGYTTGTGVMFAAGDRLQIEYDTQAGWDGNTGTLICTLWVSYDA